MLRIIFMSLVLLLTACSKDDDNNNSDNNTNNNPGPVNKRLSFEKDGVLIYTTSDTAGWKYESNFFGARSLSVGGFFNGGDFIGIMAMDTSHNDDFSNMNFAPSSYNPFIVYSTDTSSSSPQYDQILAAFTITECDTVNKTITGTFSGSLEDIITHDTVRITNGKFTKLRYYDFN